MTSTRANSPKKPTDHKPGADDMVAFDFEGIRVTIPADTFEDLELAEDLTTGRVISGLARFIDAGDLEKVLEAGRALDSRGRLMARHFEPLVSAAAEACGAKNS
jgi:hypothetical protein